MVGLFNGADLYVHGGVLNSSTPKVFCISYSEEILLRTLVGHVERDLMRQKREPISLTLAFIHGQVKF